MKVGYFIAVLMLFGGCATFQPPEKEPVPTVPDYVKVPHPTGTTLADLKSIFFNPLAPKAALGEFADTCDSDYQKLKEFTRVKDELKTGAEELVLQDAEKMHWCFYAKISKLQEMLQSEATWSARQKKVLEVFDFLSPIANAYLTLYHDSRYLRWATQYYSKISEWVFFKKMVPSAESTLLLVNEERAPSSLDAWVANPKTILPAESIFVKYGIPLPPSIIENEVGSRAPASVPAESSSEASGSESESE